MSWLFYFVTMPTHVDLRSIILGRIHVCYFSHPVVFAHLQPFLLYFGQCQRFISVHAGVTQVIMTLPFSLFEIRRSATTPSTALHAFAPVCALRRTPLSLSLSPSSRLRTLPLPGTRNCPPEYVSSPPSECPALPFGGLCVALPSSIG